MSSTNNATTGGGTVGGVGTAADAAHQPPITVAAPSTTAPAAPKVPHGATEPIQTARKRIAEASPTRQQQKAEKWLEYVNRNDTPPGAAKVDHIWWRKSDVRDAASIVGADPEVERRRPNKLRLEDYEMRVPVPGSQFSGPKPESEPKKHSAAEHQHWQDMKAAAGDQWKRLTGQAPKANATPATVSPVPKIRDATSAVHPASDLKPASLAGADAAIGMEVEPTPVAAKGVTETHPLVRPASDLKPDLKQREMDVEAKVVSSSVPTVPPPPEFLVKHVEERDLNWQPPTVKPHLSTPKVTAAASPLAKLRDFFFGRSAAPKAASETPGSPADSARKLTKNEKFVVPVMDIGSPVPSNRDGGSSRRLSGTSLSPQSAKSTAPFISGSPYTAPATAAGASAGAGEAASPPEVLRDLHCDGFHDPAVPHCSSHDCAPLIGNKPSTAPVQSPSLAAAAPAAGKSDATAVTAPKTIPERMVDSLKNVFRRRPSAVRPVTDIDRTQSQQPVRAAKQPELILEFPPPP